MEQPVVLTMASFNSYVRLPATADVQDLPVSLGPAFWWMLVNMLLVGSHHTVHHILVLVRSMRHSTLGYPGVSGSIQLVNTILQVGWTSICTSIYYWLVGQSQGSSRYNMTHCHISYNTCWLNHLNLVLLVESVKPLCLHVLPCHLAQEWNKPTQLSCLQFCMCPRVSQYSTIQFLWENDSAY